MVRPKQEIFMTNFEKLKKANPDKYVEFIHEGQTFHVKLPRPAESERKMKEMKLLKNVGEKGAIQANVNESFTYQQWACIAMLHDKNEDGSYSRSFTDEQVSEAYTLLSNEFVSALNALAKTLRPKNVDEEKESEEKNA